MRLVRRLLLAAGLAAGALGIAVLSCGSDAVGVDACRQIEDARCGAAPNCQPGFDVNACVLFYRDDCLNGIANSALGAPDAGTIQACVDAINGVAACVDAGEGPATCAAAILADAGEGGAPPLCALITVEPQDLAACAFVIVPPVVITDAGTDADAADAADAE